MASISTADSTSSFSQGEGPPPLPHQSIEELMVWFSSELHSFISANTMLAPLAVPTQAGNPKGPEPAHANANQVHYEGITTLATASIPFSGSAVPITVMVSLVPLHVGTSQYPPSHNPSPPPPLDQAGGLRLLLPASESSEPSPLSMDDPMTGSDIPIYPRYDLEYVPTLSDFPIVPRNSNPLPEARHHYQPPGHGDPIQGPVPNSTPPRVIALPDVAMYPPSLNQTLGGAYLTSGHPLSSSLINRGSVHPAHKNKESRQTRLLDQTYPTYPTNTVGPIRPRIRRAGVDQRLSRHQCTMCDASYLRPSGLNRHYKDKHMTWMACHHCNSEFSLGRMYKFTEHLQTCPGA
ncbi:hypothetical protein V8E53_010453 [Lactarius tabidus]